VGRCSVALEQCGAEGGGFALKAVAPMGEAEAQSEVGKYGGEVIECGDSARGGVQGRHLVGGKEWGGKWRRTSMRRWCEGVFRIELRCCWGWWRGWAWVENHVHVASEDVDELPARHVGAHCVVECNWRFCGV
jgi:hypothetical protein